MRPTRQPVARATPSDGPVNSLLLLALLQAPVPISAEHFGTPARVLSAAYGGSGSGIVMFSIGCAPLNDTFLLNAGWSDGSAFSYRLTIYTQHSADSCAVIGPALVALGTQEQRLPLHLPGTFGGELLLVPLIVGPMTTADRFGWQVLEMEVTLPRRIDHMAQAIVAIDGRWLTTKAIRLRF